MSQPIRRIQVMKRPGGRSPNWYLRYWQIDPRSGKNRERWKSTGTTVRKRAEQQRRELEQALTIEADKPTVTTWAAFKSTFFEKQIARKPVTTVKFYENSLAVFERLAKPVYLQDISSARIEDFADARLKEGVAPATVNRDLRHLKAALRWAARRGLIEAAPDFHGLFVREPKKKPVVIPEEDFLALVSATQSDQADLRRRSGEWWRAFLYIAYYVGLRRGEALALSWSDIDLKTREVRVQATTSKGRKERVLPMAAGLAEIIGSWRRKNPSAGPQDPVLPWPYDTDRPLYDDWKRLHAAADLPEGRRYTLKNCRSSCASALIASNVPTVVVKDFLGHASVATTENYYVNTKPAMRSVADAREVRIEGDAATTDRASGPLPQDEVSGEALQNAQRNV